ncbi:MAG: hypothetical protein IJU95_06555 [Treponema sp.]|nr:hypothetical protein [Treponema sp.]
MDASGNVGERKEQLLTVDGMNVYVKAVQPGENRNPAEGNGSSACPFTSFEKAVAAVNSCNGLTVHIEGNVVVSSDILIEKSCVIEGSRGCLSFAKDAGISIHNADVKFKGCQLVQQSAINRSAFINVLGGRIFFDSCDVTASFELSGNLVNLHSAELYAGSSSFSVYSSSYSSVFYSSASRLEIDSSCCSSSSYTSLVFCMLDSDLRLERSIASVSCNTGRIADFSGGSYAFEDNLLNGALKAEGIMGKLSAVRTSGAARNVSVVSNRIRGFEKW